MGPHEANLFDIAQKYGDVMQSRAFLESALGDAAG
jgi:hypothetical protein